MDISTTQVSRYLEAVPRPFFTWQGSLTLQLVTARRKEEIGHVTAKTALCLLRRLCFNCGERYCLFQVFEERHVCNSHPMPLYWRHETVGWEGGGDSWDYKGFPCCGADKADEESGEPIGYCLSTVHMERLDDQIETPDWALLYSEPPELEYCESDPESSLEYLRSLKVSEREKQSRIEEAERERMSWIPPFVKAVCRRCHHEACLCHEDGAIFDFDEDDLRKESGLSYYMRTRAKPV